jgi:hypothetical protein
MSMVWDEHMLSGWCRYSKDYKRGDNIIQQGDEDGDEFFVMANGL